MEKQKIILDVDPGADDAIAMIYAFLCKELDIKLISVVGGNVGIDQAGLNALFLTENFAKYNIPVVKGSGKSLKVTIDHKLSVHGKKGLGSEIEVESTNLKEINRPDYGADEAIRDTIIANKGEIIYVCLGPSTNLALALRKYPELKKMIKSVLIMGGSVDGSGSITPFAGFNVYCDPEACKEVIKSRLPIVFSPKELGLSAYLTSASLNKWVTFGRTGETAKKICTGYHDLLLPTNKVATHDLCAIMSIVHPEFYTSQKVTVKLNTTMNKKRGQTIFTQNENSRITLLTSCNRSKVLKEFEKKLKSADI